jgi:hypothetical protein
VLLKLLKCHQYIHYKYITYNTYIFNQTFSYQILVYFVGYLQACLFHLYYQRSIIFAVDSALQHFSLPLVRSMNSGYEEITLSETLGMFCGLMMKRSLGPVDWRFVD